jgi:hypothetical protein
MEHIEEQENGDVIENGFVIREPNFFLYTTIRQYIEQTLNDYLYSNDIIAKYQNKDKIKCCICDVGILKKIFKTHTLNTFNTHAVNEKHLEKMNILTTKYQTENEREIKQNTIRIINKYLNIEEGQEAPEINTAMMKYVNTTINKCIESVMKEYINKHNVRTHVFNKTLIKCCLCDVEMEDRYMEWKHISEKNHKALIHNITRQYRMEHFLILNND